MASSAVKNVINSHNIAVFSKSYCRFCKLAKDSLKMAGVNKFEVVELDLHPEGSQMQAALKEITGISTVPHVFIKQKYVGGGTDVEKLSKSGKLTSMVKNLQV